jgi:cell division protein ZapA (FtsZ GTPase activity inhibitor)
MDELSIKVNILGRTYPLKIKKADEERVNRAVRLINDRLRDYEQQYAVTDKIDLLSMCSLQLAGELLSSKDQSVKADDDSVSKIGEIEGLIAASLQK